MVKTGMKYVDSFTLDQKHISHVTMHKNLITSDYPSIYTIFNPDSEVYLMELTEPVLEENRYDDFTFEIKFEFSLDQIAYARSDYNLLQFIGDVGSLYGALYGLV